MADQRDYERAVFNAIRDASMDADGVVMLHNAQAVDALLSVVAWLLATSPAVRGQEAAYVQRAARDLRKLIPIMREATATSGVSLVVVTSDEEAAQMAKLVAAERQRPQ